MLKRWLQRRRIRKAQRGRAGFKPDAKPISAASIASMRRVRAELAELDRRLDAGEITQDEYDRRRAKGWEVQG